MVSGTQAYSEQELREDGANAVILVAFLIVWVGMFTWALMAVL